MWLIDNGVMGWLDSELGDSIVSMVMDLGLAGGDVLKLFRRAVTRWRFGGNAGGTRFGFSLSGGRLLVCEASESDDSIITWWRNGDKLTGEREWDEICLGYLKNDSFSILCQEIIFRLARLPHRLTVWNVAAALLVVLLLLLLMTIGRRKVIHARRMMIQVARVHWMSNKLVAIIMRCVRAVAKHFHICHNYGRVGFLCVDWQ